MGTLFIQQTTQFIIMFMTRIPFVAIPKKEESPAKVFGVAHFLKNRGGNKLNIFIPLYKFLLTILCHGV